MKRKFIGPLTKKQTMRKKRKTNNPLFKDTGKSLSKVKKEIETVYADIISISVPTVSLINGLITGIGFQERIGLETMMNSVQFKFTILPNSRQSATAGTNVLSNAIRISIVYDNDCRGSLPVYADIFAGNGPSDLAKFSNSDRFTMLYSKVHVPESFTHYQVQTAGTTTISNSDYVISKDEFVKIKLKSKFNSLNNGDITDFNSGAVYLCTTGLNGAPLGGIDGRSYMYLNSRIRFEDV